MSDMKWRGRDIGRENILSLVPNGIGLNDRHGQGGQQDRCHGKTAESDGQWRARLGNLAIDGRHRTALRDHGGFCLAVLDMHGALPKVSIFINRLRHDTRSCGSDQPKRSREGEHSTPKGFQLIAVPAQHLQ